MIFLFNFHTKIPLWGVTVNSEACEKKKKRKKVVIFLKKHTKRTKAKEPGLQQQPQHKYRF